MLELPFKLAKYCGILPSYFGDHWLYKLLILINILNGLNLTIPQVIYFIENIDNFEAATEIIGSFFNVAISASKILILLFNNQKLKKVYETINKLVSDKNRTNFSLSKSADLKARQFTINFCVVVYFSIFGVNLSPLLAKLFEYLKTGAVIQYKDIFPFKTSYHANIYFSPVYEILYAVFAFGIALMANGIIAVDVLFLGICLHICALFDDLKVQIQNLNKLLTQKTPTIKKTNQIKALIDYHNLIYDLLAELQDVFGGVFFSQFFGTMCVLCTQAYLAILNLTNAQIFFYMTFYTASACQLLLYTYFGQLITNGSEKVLLALMDLDWSQLPPKNRFYISAMIQRAQKPSVICFMNIIRCSLRTFQSVLMTSYNLFALLRSATE